MFQKLVDNSNPVFPSPGAWYLTNGARTTVHVFQEFGSFSSAARSMEEGHPNRCWRIRINNRSLMGINSIKKCTAFLSFLECSSTCISWLYAAACCLSRARAKNIWRSSALSSELRVRSFPGARCVPAQSWRPPNKWRFSGSLGDW